MGIQDRDWYIAELRRKLEYRERAGFRRSKSQDDRDAPFHQTSKKIDGKRLGDLPGANWHWTVKLIAMGWVSVLIMMAMRYIGR
jgi:hypothetical protein